MKKKSLKPVGNIKPPASLIQLEQTFNSFDDVLKEIDGTLSPIYHILSDIVPLLELPNNINIAIKELDEVIISIEAATSILIPIPIIGEVVAGADEIIDEIVEVINDFQSTIITPLQDFCKPIEDVITKIEKPIKDIDIAIKDLESVVSKCVQALSIIQEALTLVAAIGNNACDAAGHKAIAKTFDKLVHIYNDVTIKIIGKGKKKGPLVIIDDAMQKINEGLTPLSDVMSKLQTGTFDKISNSIQTVDDFLAKLHPLNDFLSHIQGVLKPFEWVLDKVGKIVSKILEPVLKPLLKPLEDKIAGALGFPDDFIAQLAASFADSSDKDTIALISKNLITDYKTVAAHQSGLEKTIEDLFSHDINKVCDDLLKTIQKYSKNN